ncbi:MAG: MATE family efflux transporter [Ruminococcaceae bacterium]|nr:MATE family efflux transporter [Oscillospiraceae bacterium]
MNRTATKQPKERSLTGQIIRYIVPLMLTGILQLLYNAADNVVVGRFDGSNALAAVGSTGALVNLILNVFIGLSVGTAVAVAHDYGANDHEGVQKTVHTSILISIFFGVIVGAFGCLCSGTFLKWMDTPPDVLPLSTTYLAIYFLGTPASMVYNFGASILRSVGDTKRPLFFLTLSGIINVVLNLIFVIIFRMSVAGVALATIISQYVSMVMIVVCLVREKGCCHLDFRKLRIHRDKLQKIVRVGLPAGIQGSVFSISNVVIQSSVNSFGSLVMAGNTAAAQLEGFAYTAMNSVYHAALTFVGQNMGAKRYDMINKVVFRCFIVVMCIGLTVGVLMYTFAEPLLKIYLPNDPDAIPYGITRMGYLIIPYFLCGTMEVMVGGQRGMGMSIVPMITSLVGSCLLRVVWVMTIFAAFRSLPVLYLSYPISWGLTTAAHTVFYFRHLGKIKKAARAAGESV